MLNKYKNMSKVLLYTHLDYNFNLLPCSACNLISDFFLNLFLHYRVPSKTNWVNRQPRRDKENCSCIQDLLYEDI
jgi:hypothetical protein